MKKLIFAQLVLLLMLPLFFMACSDEDEGPIVLLPKLDGFYVFGTNTIAEAPTDPESRMALAVLDHTKPAGIDNLDGVYGKYLYIGANSTISFALVENKVGKVLGADGGGSMDSAKVVANCPIKDIVIHGELKEGASEISVTEEGLYYAYVNTNTNEFIIMKVKANMIGDATKLQWAKGTSLPMKSTSKDFTEFEGTNIELYDAHGYRYRMNDGWAVYEDPNIVTLNSMGVFSYGTAWDTNINDIGFFNDNIPHKVTGLYTVNLKYTASTGECEETKTKTGNILVNYTDYSVGVIGDATDGGSFNGDGTGGYEVKKPSKAGNVYTWTWNNVSLIQDKEFIFLQNATWGGLQIDYLGAAVSGTAITGTKVIDATAAPVNGPYHNFHVITGGSYNIVLTINAENEGRTVAITTN
ncbi:MAG: hypothetical protein ABI663_13010 [Chryseolinea sp.]